MNLNKIRTLSVEQWRWVFVAWFALWRVDFKLRFDKSDWLMELLGGCPELTPSKVRQEIAEQMHESVRIAARLHPLSPACLPKSVVLLNMLRRATIPAKLCLGVSKQKVSDKGASSESSTPTLSSHAWIEISEGPVCEPESVRDDFTLVGIP